MSHQTPPTKGRLGRGLACSACIRTARLLRGAPASPQLSGAHPPCSLPSHPRGDSIQDLSQWKTPPGLTQPSALWATREPVNPFSSPWEVSPTLLSTSRVQAKRAEGPSYLGGGLSNKQWEHQQGLLGQRQPGCHLTGATPLLLPSLGSSVWAMDEPAFKGHAYQEGGSPAPRQL